MSPHARGPRMANTSPTASSFFLPDFCAPRATLAIVLIVELVAVLIALARAPVTNFFWVDLAALSMFLLWIGLGSAFVLCRTSPWLSRQSVAKASSVAMSLLVGVVAVVSEVVYQLGIYFTGGAPVLSEVFPTHHAEFVLRNIGIGFIVSALTLRYFYVSAEWKRTIELEAQSRFYALQARIRPHFLFNSMNTIAALTRSNPELAEQAVEDLADLFRANLSDVKQRLRLSEEIQIARVYERIEGLRLGKRLKVDWRLEDAPMDALVPSLILQPLLENAVYHGVEGLPDGGEVTVTARIEDRTIRLAVANPVAENRPPSERNSNKLALDNIKQRLQLEWPGKSSVDVYSTAGSYSVTLTFPYSTQEQP
jgi:two-component system, LytTR family, sensor histidine kinase AlgZ